VQQLKTLQADHWSAGQIARKMGLSRNAVIGKIHRLGLKLSGRKEATGTRDRRRSENGGGSIARLRKRAPPVPKVEERRVGEPESRKVPVYKLDFINDCRFPTSDEAPHVHCGHPRLTPGRDHISVYCEYHTVLTRNPSHRQRGTGHGHLVYWSARSR